MNSEKYNPCNDEVYSTPYIDKKEWRKVEDTDYLYVHGGFENTDTKFSFFFPKKENYEGRFYHFLSPFQGSEDSSEREPNMIFAITHGGYFVETNMGGTLGGGEILFQSSAACANYSRTVAVDVYGYEHRPYGYVFGGSGGSYKTMGCLEKTTGVWDGGVPFVIGNVMAIPNSGLICAYLQRSMNDYIDSIKDAMEPGADHDIYAGMDEESKSIIDEAFALGVPKDTMFCFQKDSMEQGSLPVLIPAIKSMDPTYFEDFWTKEGYKGFDKNSFEYKNRIKHKAKVVSTSGPYREDKAAGNDEGTGTDDAWKRLTTNKDIQLWIEVDSVPGDDKPLDGSNIRITTGKSEGAELPIYKIEGNKVFVVFGLDIEGANKIIENIKAGDEVVIDNSDFLALQTYYRHQVPGNEWTPYFDVYKYLQNEDGTPKYPQRGMLLGPLFSMNGGGFVQSGSIESKIIIACSLADAGAMPWMADWYKRKIKETLGEEKGSESVRLFFTEHALHGDDAGFEDTHYVSYLGSLYQNLIDIAKWVEQGIEPPKETVYEIKNGQAIVSDNVNERCGQQPIVHLTVNGKDRADVSVGEKVELNGVIEIPHNTGKITKAYWYFNDGEKSQKAEIKLEDNDEKSIVTTKTKYDKPGTYFVTLKGVSNRNEDDKFTDILNLRRVRVVVK